MLVTNYLKYFSTLLLKLPSLASYGVTANIRDVERVNAYSALYFFILLLTKSDWQYPLTNKYIAKYIIIFVAKLKLAAIVVAHLKARVVVNFTKAISLASQARQLGRKQNVHKLIPHKLIPGGSRKD